MGYNNKDFTFEKKKRVYIHIGDLRIAPDAIAGYLPLDTSGNAIVSGVTIAFANGRYFDVITTKEEQQRFLDYMDKLKAPEKL